LTRDKDRLTPEQDRLTHGQDLLTLGQDLLTLGQDLLTFEQDRLTLERDRLTLEQEVLTRQPGRLTCAERAICGGGSLKNPVKYEIFYGGLIKIRIQDQQVKDGVWEYSKKFHKNH
jgi:hypothetical protein